MEDIPESKDKNNTIFIEIRFQKNTLTAMRKNARVFRLNKNYHTLDTSDKTSNLCRYLNPTMGITRLSVGGYTMS